MSLNRIREDVYTYLEELTYSIVAESGVVTDRYHLGKIILRSFKDAPDFLMQIDGATDETDTFKSALDRSVRCAINLKKMGIKHNDNIFLMGPNGIDLAMPMYACFYLGVGIITIDMTLEVHELQDAFQQCYPKVVFCRIDNASKVLQALQFLHYDTFIITFGEIENFTSFRRFIDNDLEEKIINDFKPSEFDTRTTNCMLVSTSGSTGVPKLAALTYEEVFIGFSDVMAVYSKFPTPFRLAIVPSPLQWLTAVFHFVLSPILRYTRVQSSLPFTPEHGHYLINKYKPTYMIANPNLTLALLKNHEQCDFSSFENIVLTGSSPSKMLLEDIRKFIPNAVIHTGFGITEASGYVFQYAGGPIGSCGKPLRRFEYKLVDYETEKEILEPKQPGELWVKGRGIFKGYYKKPEINAVTLTEDRWFKTGDMMYRDENDVYYYVDRIKMLLKYNNHHVSPIEIENVILTHPGVYEVAVAGVPDPNHGELPIAFVVPNDGYRITADEIKDIVKNSLTDTKHLRGGVVFLNNLPKTATGKLNRMGLKSLALNMKPE